FKKLALRNVRFAIYDHLTGRSLFSFQRTNTSCFMRPCLSGDLNNISHSLTSLQAFFILSNKKLRYISLPQKRQGVI
ncbi:hypothetical protein, partial [Paenibacillus lignilyticus]